VSHKISNTLEINKLLFSKVLQALLYISIISRICLHFDFDDESVNDDEGEDEDDNEDVN
jgi:hypothetical protein